MTTLPLPIDWDAVLGTPDDDTLWVTAADLQPRAIEDVPDPRGLLNEVGP